MRPPKQQTALDSNRSSEACPLGDQLSPSTRRKQAARYRVVTTPGELSTRFTRKANDARLPAQKRRERKDSSRYHPGGLMLGSRVFGTLPVAKVCQAAGVDHLRQRPMSRPTRPGSTSSVVEGSGISGARIVSHFTKAVPTSYTPSAVSPMWGCALKSVRNC